MVEEENGVIVNDEGELLLHEDSITDTMTLSVEDLAVLQASKDAAEDWAALAIPGLAFALRTAV